MMNPISAVGNVLANTLNFSTRASRSEYWWFYLFHFIIVIGTLIYDGTRLEADQSYNVLSGAFIITTIALFFPKISVFFRRLHDVGYSGWWCLLAIVPFGSIALFVFTVLPSERRQNRWGPVPGQDYLGPDIFSDELGANSKDDPFAPGTFFGPDKNAPVLSREEAAAQRKAEVQDYYRTRVMGQQT